MTAKQEAIDIYHSCLNIGKGYISEYLAGLFAWQQVSMALRVSEESEDEEKWKYWLKVEKELKKLLNYK